MYSIEFAPHAEKFLKKLNKNEADIILNKIYSIRENPFRFLERLKGEKLWKLRIMKFRAEMDVLVSANRIIVLTIGHRKNIYDKH